MAVSLWPALGLTVLDELGSPVPTSGISVGSLTSYYLDLVVRGYLLTYDPLNAGSSPSTVTTQPTIFASTVVALATTIGSAEGQIAVVSGHTNANDGGGGTFVWRAGDSATADGGTVLGTGSGRWRRVYSGALSVKWFGATGNGSTPDATAVQAALTAVPSGGELLIPDGTYMIGSALTRSAAITIRGTGTLKRSGSFGRMLHVSGTAGTYLDHCHIEGVTFDGNDAGAIAYSAGTPNFDCAITYVTNASVSRCQFVNPRQASLVALYCTHVDISRNRFADGPPSSGSADSTTVFASKFQFCTNLTVHDNTFSSDITYDGGDKTQTGVVAASPTAIFCTNNEHVTVTHNKSRSAGNLELYEANRNAVVAGNEFYKCHLPPIKVGSIQRVVITGNVITDPEHFWLACITVSAYNRLTSFGCLRPYQGHVQIADNIILNAKCDTGAIFVNGQVLSTANLDTRIAAQGGYGYTTTNIVTKSGSNYFYTDFDGAVYDNIDQEYLLARNVQISNNLVDGFAVSAIYTYVCDSADITDNSLTNCASLDTTFSNNKNAFRILNVRDASVSRNSAQMLTTTQPKINGSNSHLNGVFATSDIAYFRRLSDIKIDGNRFNLTQVQYPVYVEDLRHVSILGNRLGVIKFLNASSAWIASAGKSVSAKIADNRYSLIDGANTPAESTEYLRVQGGFLRVDWQDDRHSVDISRRVVWISADYTNPNQVASGYYDIGSTIVISGQQWKTYQRCETAGYLAKAYDSGTTYLKGNLVVQGGHYYFALANLTMGTAPPATPTSDANWEYVSSTAAAFTGYTL